MKLWQITTQIIYLISQYSLHDLKRCILHRTCTWCFCFQVGCSISEDKWIRVLSKLRRQFELLPLHQPLLSVLVCKFTEAYSSMTQPVWQDLDFTVLKLDKYWQYTGKLFLADLSSQYYTLCVRGSEVWATDCKRDRQTHGRSSLTVWLQ